METFELEEVLQHSRELHGKQLHNQTQIQEYLAEREQHYNTLRSLYSVQDLTSNPEVSETYYASLERVNALKESLRRAEESIDLVEDIIAALEAEIARREQ